MSAPNIEPLPSQHSPELETLLPNGIYKAIPRPRLTPEERESLKKPTVLIVGAGIGGLTLGVLLKKGGIDFQIFERSKEVKPLGSAMSMGGSITSLLRQVGIYDEFKDISKPYTQIQVFNEDLQSELVMDFTERVAIAGEQESIITRPDMYAMLLRQIPKENILMNKKVLSFLQGENGVMIRCSDDSTYDGDILVGADGAYSAVRQHMYAALKKESRLPSSDDVALPFSSVCLVGQTEVLDPEEFPDLQLPLSQFKAVLGNDNTYSWTTFTTASNTVCYSVVQLLNKETSKQNDSFRCSEWGSEAAEVMCKEVRHFRLPWGGKDGKECTMGDLIDRTPKGMVSKVMLEEKVFDCWYDRRTVLLGDACHKLSPAGGAGAITAMHDAIALANWICAIPSKEMSDIEEFFKEYRTERFPIAKEIFETSRMFNNIGGRGFVAKLTRAMMKHMPRWLWRMIQTKQSQHRVQASFLPLVEDKGTSKPKHSASFDKTLAIQQKKAEEKSKAQKAAAVV